MHEQSPPTQPAAQPEPRFNAQHGCWGMHGPQQPLQQKLPQQTGLKALYGRQQMEYLQQQVQHLQPKANACPEARPSVARLRQATA
jgi:hypothetical protein